MVRNVKQGLPVTLHELIVAITTDCAHELGCMSVCLLVVVVFCHTLN